MNRSILNRFILWLTDHLLLSLLWLAACLPLVTAPAATAALFDVTRRRTAGEDPALASAFLAGFRRHALRASLLGYGWAALGAVLLADLAIAAQMDPAAGPPVRVALLVLLLLYALTTVALFPVLVSGPAAPHLVARAALLVVLHGPARATAALAVAAGAVLAVWTVPLAVVLAPALVAEVLHRLCGAAPETVHTGTTPAMAHTGAGPGAPRTAPTAPAPPTSAAKEILR